MTVPTLHANLLPPRPRLVLRVGFAGVRDLPANMMEPITAVLVSVFETIARQLVEIAPGQPTRPGQPPRISRFYSQEAPSLRLITGLAEGADALALGALDLVAAGPAPVSGFSAELAAVLPFDVAVYRRSRNEAFRPEFDRQAARCAYILTLDGLYDKPHPDTKLAQRRRAGAYRAQSTFLLRQSDLLVVVANPDVPGKPGGTMETVHAALAFDLPVVFIHAGTGEVRLIDPGQDFGSALGIEAPDKSEWQATLRGWVTNVATGSSTLTVPQIYAADERVRGGVHSHGRLLLEEFLANAELPPMVVGPDGRPRRKTTFRERRWLALETRFRPGGLSGAQGDPSLSPYSIYRSRASALSQHYSGLYRGAFVQNYRLAVYAVTLATLSLALLATAHVGTTATARAASGRRAVKIDVMAAIVAPADAPPSPIAEPKVLPPHEALSLPSWLVPAIFSLGLVKLVILVWIFQNTREANDGDWNDKAVDYRYLAERLRTMFYLPRIGSFQPPAAAMPQYVARAARQSAVDWLLDAIVRSISPAELPLARKIPTTLAGDGTQCDVTIIRLDPKGLLADLRDRWVDEQALYHDRTARTMDRMFHFSENAGSRLSKIVMALVGVDLIFIVAERLPFVPETWKEIAELATPWSIMFTAVLPAAVASLNAIRFQTECRRLAERSAVVRTILWGLHSKDAPKGGRWAEADTLSRRIATALSDDETNLGAWSAQVLRLTETVAADFVHEVTEWSVLYAKEVPDV